MTYAIQEFSVLPSTNTYVKENAAALAHGDIIVARRQTNGRGRMERLWRSEKGGLYFTVVLKPANTTHLANLTQLLSLSVCRAINETGVAASVKWPNDVLINGAKVAGILSEAVLEGDRIAALALGAGINVNQRVLEVPGKATTSLFMEGISVSEDYFMQTVLDRFFAAYEQVLSKGFSVIREAYMERLVMLGDEICVDTGRERLRGTFLRLTRTGRLVLGLHNKSTREISVGDVQC